MESLNKIKPDISKMGVLALQMWRETFRSFMEHNTELIAGVLAEEDKLNKIEKELTSRLVDAGKPSTGEARDNILIFQEVVQDLELIGDYCKDILERVEIKIAEKLLFSDDAVKEYEELYHKTEYALDEVVRALERDDAQVLNSVLKSQEHIDSLVDQYRKHHNERMLKGVCSPMGCNMYLNMLDFTAAVYYHAKKIARNLMKIK